MTRRTIKIPRPDHPITIEWNKGRVIADTHEALTLREARCPPVQYTPRRDVDIAY
jgi:uncharacterized protein (DUF427 family)